ncbi:MAG: bacterial lipid biosynthesis acyltransferase family protein [Xanthomonadaceae bacterium]|nr:bacterial lipid biosynthesis acyltransferase family protein [Xanthomonadaceae bacterium]
MLADAIAGLLHALVAASTRLPWRWLYGIGDGVAAAWRWMGARESRVARRNLELALCELGEVERERLQHEVLRTTARQALETLRFWTHPHTANLALIGEMEGLDLFDAALAGGRGVIVAAPHYGNWELLNQWLAAHTPLAILYRAPDSAIGEAFLHRVRADADDRVTQVRAEGAAVRQLFKRLRDGGVVGILPDQQPKAGEGEFAAFFGVPALTMTLLSRLAARSDATVLFAYCERIDWTPTFRLRFERAPSELASVMPGIGVTALNAMVESIARRDLAQYQWTYKRYTVRPPGSAVDNPYRDFERH